MSGAKIQDFIRPNEDFQASINIAFDLQNDKRVESLIPTRTVCHFVETLLEDVVVKSTRRAKILVGAYGKGKSHIALASLAAMSIKRPDMYSQLVTEFKRTGSGFAETLDQFVVDGPRLLPVVISGSSTDIARSFLYALRTALRDEGLEKLMPQTNYEGALEVIDRWRTEYPSTYMQLENALEMNGQAIVAELQDYNSSVYGAFVRAYPKLTAGSEFDTLANAGVIDAYDHVLDGLASVGYSGVYVVYDEFSKYLESNITNASVEDTKLLQDFAERCSRSTQNKQLHILLISHKNLSNYIDSNLPKEKVDGWRGVSGRFVELEIFDDSEQSYELISHAIHKDPAVWNEYLEDHAKILESVESRYLTEGIIEEGSSECVVFGCFPLHPISTFLLPRVSELVAQNERTLFTFLSSSEPKSLPHRAQAKDVCGRFVTPDYIYDYFEPLLRKEHYSSEAYTLYKLTRASLGKVSNGSLESRIIKTVALVYLVSQFNLLPPTRAMLTEVFEDAGIAREDIDRALDRLIETDSIVYLRNSDSHIKLKESSGIKVDEEVHNEAERLRNSMRITDILNTYQSGRALYPSRHNAKFKITRYFDCVFANESAVRSILMGDECLQYSGAGCVIAVLPDKAESIAELSDLIESYGGKYPTVVFAIPRTYKDISIAAYRYAASLRLRDEAGADEILKDEYELIVEDYSKTVSAYIASFFRPELKEAWYFIRGERKNRVVHRKKLSELLSSLCDEVYFKTPVINNELINKDTPTSIALSSRAKILAALCAKSIEANLGFVGNGQETSMARSVLEVTRVVEHLSSNPIVCLSSEQSQVKSITDTIIDFATSCDGESFALLYERLTAPEHHIGAKRGPIPILLALVLRDYRDAVCILRDGEERPLDKQTLEDIDASPEAFTLLLVDWDEEKAKYVSDVAKIFGSTSSSVSKTQAVECARTWFVSLPQFTRVSHVDHSAESVSEFSREHRAFLKAINQASINPNDFLFRALPQAFGLNEASSDLVEALRNEVDVCNSYIDNVIFSIGIKLKKVFSTTVLERESLSSVFAEWRESLSPQTRTHVFSGSGSKIMAAIENFTNDERASVMRLAKAAVSLRIEDWDDALYDRFFEIIADFVDEVVSFENNDDVSAGSQTIVYITDKGREETRSFDSVECSPRAELLRNQILSSIEEMGQSISKDEKRQVVFEILKGLCS